MCKRFTGWIASLAPRTRDRPFADGYVVTTCEVEAELQRIGHAFK
jgi:hypothetical protein